MKKQKVASAATSIKILLLVVGLIGLTEPSVAANRVTVEAPQDNALEKVQWPTSLGGVPLERWRSWRSAAAYRIAINMPAAVYARAESAATQAGAGLDTMRTASIIPGVFGSVALSMRNFPVAARWAPVYRAIAECSASNGCGRRSVPFSNIVEIAKAKAFKEKLSFVNSTINRLIAYKKDSAIYGSLDYWAKPSETLDRRAGDCEDFAILKMTALLSSGIPAQSMSLVILQDRRRGFFHAVLSVNTPAGAFILDNLSNLVLKDSGLPDYQPLYSFSTDRAWIHGAKAGAPQLAEIKGGLATVSPGEGI